MELKIGEKLRMLRRERNLTQEEAALHLGVSFQSVSKCERGDGYPDITMLPALANYFGVTVDQLIGMDEISSEQRLGEIKRQWEENRKEGLHAENTALMREALRTYPNNALLLVQLSASLERLGDGLNAAEKRENLRESIAVQEQILNYCEDSEIRGAVLFNIADSYLRWGDREKALEYANKLPNFYKTRENALVRILNDDTEKRSISAAALERIAWSLACHLTVLAETEHDRGYYDKIVRILDILYGGSNEFINKIREKANAKCSGN